MNPFWSNVRLEHVIQAIKEFDLVKESCPEPRNTFLIYNNKRYPAKHIRGMAYRIANKIEISKNDYSGGQETAEFLRKLGFTVEYERKTLKPRAMLEAVPKIHEVEKPSIQLRVTVKLNSVSQKNAIQKLLQKHYGYIEIEKKFNWLKTPNNQYLPEEYKAIVSALSSYRNQTGFQKSFCLLPCDIVLEEYKLIIEYDENQHFSEARRITLENYPSNIQLRFSREEWIEACRGIKAKDNDPIDRDERRAYFDAVRDIESHKNGYTLIRIKHGDIDWESDNAETYLSQVLGERKKDNMELHSHKIARLIVTGLDYDSCGNPYYLRLNSLMDAFVNKYHGKISFEFVITCGGFLTFKFPESLRYGLNIPFAERNQIQPFQNEATKTIQGFLAQLPEGTFKRLKEVADYFTIGIDGHNPVNKQMIELVAIYDLKGGQVISWTGKFYPIEQQKNDLIKIIDLKSHFIELNDEKVAILGCHDLNVYSPRGQAAANPDGWKRRIADEFKLLCKEFKPDILIHHPHLTHSPNVWNLAWRTIEKELPFVKHFASGIKYTDRKGVVRDFQSVLSKTKKGDVTDYFV